MISQRLIYLSLTANLLLVGALGGMLLARSSYSGAASIPQESTVGERPANVNPIRAISQLPPAQVSAYQAPLQAGATAPATVPGSSTGSGSWQYGQSSSPVARNASPATGSRPSSGVSFTSPQPSSSYSNSANSSMPTGASISIPASYGASAISSASQPSSSSGAVNPVASDAAAPSVPARTITGSVQPDGLGNSFIDKGQKVAVANAPAADGSTTEDLNVIVTPDSNGPSTDSSNAGEKPVAFTREQDLFRSKWGWAAYGEAQRAAWDVSLGHASN